MDPDYTKPIRVGYDHFVQIVGRNCSHQVRVTDGCYTPTIIFGLDYEVGQSVYVTLEEVISETACVWILPTMRQALALCYEDSGEVFEPDHTSAEYADWLLSQLHIDEDNRTALLTYAAEEEGA